jgi:integrase
MMATKKLTGVAIQRLKPNPDGSRSYTYDSSFPGLCLRVGKRDKSWVYYYRLDGKLRGKTLGKYAPGRVDHMDRASTIEAAERIDAIVGKGKDPDQIEIQADVQKAKPTTENPNAFHRRVEEFLKWYKTSPKRRGGKLRSPATVAQARRLLSEDGSIHYMKPLAYSDVSTIRRADIIRLLESMSDKPFQANRIHSYLELFFNWAWDRGYCDPSPMAGLKKQYAENSRKRHLSPDEIKALWSGCLDLGYPLGDWVRFTLATGQRPGECRNLSRDDLHNGVWLVEGGDPKNDERHRIPLPKIAREIIKAAPEFKKPYVFTTTGGEKPITQGGKPYAELYGAVGIETDWRPHDLRRTFQTLASEELDIEPYLLGAICNQISVAKPGVSSVYNQAKWMKPKEEALEAWNDYLQNITK